MSGASKATPLLTLYNATVYLMSIAEDLARATHTNDQVKLAQALTVVLKRDMAALAHTSAKADAATQLLTLLTTTLAALLTQNPDVLVLPNGHTQRERAAILLRTLEDMLAP
jgi:hypothetical protein